MKSFIFNVISGFVLGGAIAALASWGNIVQSFPNGGTYTGGTSITQFSSVSGWQNITAAATTTIDLSAGNEIDLDLSTSITSINFVNPYVGECFDLIIEQEGSNTISWPSNIRWIGGSAPTLTGTAGKRDIIRFVVDASGNFSEIGIAQNE